MNTLPVEIEIEIGLWVLFGSAFAFGWLLVQFEPWGVGHVQLVGIRHPYHDGDFGINPSEQPDSAPDQSKPGAEGEKRQIARFAPQTEQTATTGFGWWWRFSIISASLNYRIR